MMAVWTTKTNKQAQGKCGRTLEILEDGLVRTVTSDRARTSSSTRALWYRCRPHLKQTFDFKTSNLPVLFMRKSKDLKGWFVLLQWSSCYLGEAVRLSLSLRGFIVEVSVLLLNQPAFRRCPPRGLLPYMAFNGMCLWRAYGFCPLHPEVCLKQGIQSRASLS